MDKKILYADTETTGTNPVLHDVIQFAFIVEINGAIVDTAEFKAQPFSYENINPEALEINKTTIEQIKTYPSPRETYQKIVNFFCKHIDKYDRADKFYPAGYNLHFDLDFISQFFVKNGDKYFGSFCNWKRIDPLPFLYNMDFLGKISLPNYKLETVCNHFGIQIQAHDALSDILATREVIKKVVFS